MQDVEIHFVGMSDRLRAAVTIVGLVGVVGFIAGAVMRIRGGRGWDRVTPGGALFTAAAFVATLAYSWLASPR